MRTKIFDRLYEISAWIVVLLALAFSCAVNFQTKKPTPDPVSELLTTYGSLDLISVERTYRTADPDQIPTDPITIANTVCYYSHTSETGNGLWIAYYRQNFQ